MLTHCLCLCGKVTLLFSWGQWNLSPYGKLIRGQKPLSSLKEMYTPVNRPPKWEKQAPKALKKVSNGGLLGVWNRPTESGILYAWAVLLQEAPQVHISMVTQPGLSNIPELSESRGKKQKKPTKWTDWVFARPGKWDWNFESWLPSLETVDTIMWESLPFLLF